MVPVSPPDPAPRWPHRWAISAGKRAAILADEPETPAWIMKAAGADSE